MEINFETWNYHKLLHRPEMCLGFSLHWSWTEIHQVDVPLTSQLLFWSYTALEFKSRCSLTGSFLEIPSFLCMFHVGSFLLVIESHVCMNLLFYSINFLLFDAYGKSEGLNNKIENDEINNLMCW